tara:strand:- start:1984 stop:2370 length:387 start_codon:yes stop_codon:yes gene_type:complete
MITIYNEHDARKLSDPDLRSLVQGHLTTAKENGLQDLTCIAVVEPQDNQSAIVHELGFSPLVNPLSETRFGDPAFSPAWDWLEVHRGWYELIFTVGNDGFAYILFVPANSEVNAFTQACARYAGGPEN